MNVKSLTLKNKLTLDKTGEGYWDLTAPSFIYDADLGVRALHYVTMDQIGRIDKISEIYFGSGEYIDDIRVVNNIFNPFSVNEGDVLVIPNLKRKDIVYKKPNPATTPNTAQAAYIDTGRQSEKDQGRMQRLIEKAKSSEAGVKQPMPPNMLQPGQEAKTYTVGKIQLGTNLKSKSTLKKSQTN